MDVTGMVMKVLLYILGLMLFWVGITKGQVDIAEGKEASQSPERNDSPHPAGNALSGPDQCTTTWGSYSQTLNTAFSSWWSVNLGGRCAITSITIAVLPGDGTSHLGIFSVSAGSAPSAGTPCNEKDNGELKVSNGRTETFNMNAVCEGNHLTLRVQGKIEMSLCRVRVYGTCTGCDSGFYGEYCKPCSTNCRDVCDGTSGKCISGCKSGFYGEYCKPCSIHCQGVCDSTSGACNSGCDSGFYGQYCKICSTHCKDVCDATSGACTCKEESPKAGPRCDEDCPSNCDNGCTQNNKVCNGCKGRTRTGDQCNEPCPINCVSTCFQRGYCDSCNNRWWGNKCERRCSNYCIFNSVQGNCRRADGACDRCAVGWWDIKCNQQCSTHCIFSFLTGKCRMADGACDSCTIGWWGNKCYQQCSTQCTTTSCNKYDGSCTCKTGYWGPRCFNQCSPNCVAGGCDKTNGHCTCKPGYKSPNCLNACDAGYWGYYCPTKCSEGCRNSSICHHVDGRCSCKIGFTGNRCLRCPAKKYGEGCRNDCSTYCNNDGQCNHVSGDCSCESSTNRYGGSKCDQKCSNSCGSEGCRQDMSCIGCVAGKYGSQCNNDCPPDCRLDDGVTHGCKQNHNGDCRRCKEGYYNYKCTTPCPVNCEGGCEKVDGECSCKEGFYSPDCSKRCSSNCVTPYCEKYGGGCMCKPGYKPNNCIDQCDLGRYGQNCSEICSSYCVIPNQCNHTDGFCQCQPGWNGTVCKQECPDGTYGLYCKEICSDGCNGTCNKTNGTCNCKPGYLGDKCDKKCSQGTYGVGCLNICSKECVSCNHVDGACECEPGYAPPSCKNKCGPGTYGKSCVEICGAGCDAPCHHVHGICRCLSGHQGEKCDRECDDSSFGLDCNSSCHCAGGSSDCNKTSGFCFSGSCEDGWEGSTCQQVGTKPMTTSIGPIVGPIIAVIILVVIAVGLVLWLRRRRTTRRKEAYTNQETIKVNNNGEHNNGIHSPPVCSSHISLHGLYTNVDKKPNREKNKPTTAAADDEENTYENLGIPVIELPKYIHRMKARDEAFKKEFKTIESGLHANCELGSSPEHHHKNRFKNIISYDHTRVPLLTTNGTPSTTEYINANFINNYHGQAAFIAAQGPLEHTKNDFVRMLWEQKVPLVVMVTKIKEDKKTKCEQYWPNDSEPLNFGNFSVMKKTEKKQNHFTMRQFILSKGDESRQLHHIQYLSWPDHGVPSSPAAFLEFHQKAKGLYDREMGPALVHCSAGVGRTGTFLVVDYLLDQAEAEGKVDIVGCISTMREQRVNMVQSLDQYIFIYESVLEALFCGRTMYPASDYTVLKPSITDEALAKQFQMLEKMMPIIRDEQLHEAKQNAKKNRTKDILPPKNFRVLLMTTISGHNNYINAVWVNGYETKNEFIATQSPLPHTIPDLWRCVVDSNCSTIVSLNQFNSTNCPKYCPTSEAQYGTITVSPLYQAEGETYTMNDFTVKAQVYDDSTKGPKTKKVKREVRLISLSADESVLPSASSMLAVYEAARSWKQQQHESRCLIHCLDGATITGLFLVLWRICERITAEQEVDIFHAVKQVRMSRPQFIPSKEQYKWLHDAAETYMKTCATYANL